MKLSGHISREYKGKQYEKLWVVIPNKLIEQLKWKRGEDLIAEAKGEKLVIGKHQLKGSIISESVFRG